MSTRSVKSTLATLSVSLVLGIAGESATAMDLEEIVVYGIDTSPPTPSAEAVLRAAMSDYVKALNQDLKEELERKFASMRKHEIQLAAAGISTRG